MSRMRAAIRFLRRQQFPDIDGFFAERRLRAATHVLITVLAPVAVGGVSAGMSAPDILVCGLVAASGVILFCVVAAWLFEDLLGSPLRHQRELPDPALDQPVDPESVGGQQLIERSAADLRGDVLGVRGEGVRQRLRRRAV